jgi:hypothetical protein
VSIKAFAPAGALDRPVTWPPTRRTIDRCGESWSLAAHAAHREIVAGAGSLRSRQEQRFTPYTHHVVPYLALPAAPAPSEPVGHRVDGDASLWRWQGWSRELPIGRGSTSPTSPRNSCAAILPIGQPGVTPRRHRRLVTREGSAGNLAFPSSFDPHRHARGAPALWHVGAASGIVILDRAPEGLPGALPFDSRIIPTTERSGPDGRHLVIDTRERRHRIWLREPAPGVPLMVLLPIAAPAARRTASDAALGLLAGHGAVAAQGGHCPTAFQRQRLVMLLRILDAAQAGLSSREIGTSILYPWLSGIDAQSWKASSERRRVQRLVAEARCLMASGYRQLLLA